MVACLVGRPLTPPALTANTIVAIQRTLYHKTAIFKNRTASDISGDAKRTERGNGHIHGDPPFGKDGAVLESFHVVLSLDIGGLERNVVNQVREGQLARQMFPLCAFSDRVSWRPKWRHGRASIVLESFPVCSSRWCDAPGKRSANFGRTSFTRIGLHSVYAGLAAKSVPGFHIVHTEHGREALLAAPNTMVGPSRGPSAELFFCLTEDMAAHVIAHRIVPCRKIRIIHNGIDITRYNRKVDLATCEERSAYLTERR